jgi:ABC-type dipeptide/oligopeptide/nickel transport system permease component
VTPFLLRRLFVAVPGLLGVVLVVFTLLHLSGDPAYILLPPEASDAQRAAFRHAYGLDRPLSEQAVRYVLHVVRGDFGQSFSFREPALSVVLQRVPATLELTLAAMALAGIVGIPAGLVAALKRGGGYDRGLMALSLLGQSVPTFWLGMMMILVLAVQLRLLPVSGRGTISQLVMPSVALALWLIALLARITRAEVLETLANDYVRTARAKGLPERSVAVRHALRNALLPIVTIMGIQFGTLLGGAVMTETVFAWPGVGTLILDSILKKDFPVVLAGVTFVASTFVAINLSLDVLYAVIDPRIRRS